MLPQPVSNIRTSPRMLRTQPEKATIPVAFFNIEDANSGWGIQGIADVGIVLYDYDLDDRGYVYVASTVFGWGISHDDGRADGSHLPFVHRGSIAADCIFSLRTGGRYYAAACEDGFTDSMRIYDTTTPSTPAYLRFDNRPVREWSKHD